MQLPMPLIKKISDDEPLQLQTPHDMSHDFQELVEKYYAFHEVLPYHV